MPPPKPPLGRRSGRNDPADREHQEDACFDHTTAVEPFENLKHPTDQGKQTGRPAKRDPDADSGL